MFRTVVKRLEHSAGIQAIVTANKYGYEYADFHFDNVHECRDFRAAVSRCKSVIEIDRNPYCWTVRIMDRKDHDDCVCLMLELQALVNGYWSVFHYEGRAAADSYYESHKADYERLKI